MYIDIAFCNIMVVNANEREATKEPPFIKYNEDHINKTGVLGFTNSN